MNKRIRKKKWKKAREISRNKVFELERKIGNNRIIETYKFAHYLKFSDNLFIGDTIPIPQMVQEKVLEKITHAFMYGR